MSESVITQCPHCSTSFRVNDAQLGAANGAVRCGTCLKVFNALQHQVGGAPRANAPSAAEAKPAAAARRFWRNGVDLVQDEALDADARTLMG